MMLEKKYLLISILVFSGVIICITTILLVNNESNNISKGKQNKNKIDISSLLFPPVTAGFGKLENGVFHLKKRIETYDALARVSYL
jgi:uncharacterized membrane protein YciS (DUF1049 family)